MAVRRFGDDAQITRGLGLIAERAVRIRCQCRQPLAVGRENPYPGPTCGVTAGKVGAAGDPIALGHREDLKAMGCRWPVGHQQQDGDSDGDKRITRLSTLASRCPRWRGLDQSQSPAPASSTR